jgi:hypothetical protein
MVANRGNYPRIVTSQIRLGEDDHLVHARAATRGIPVHAGVGQAVAGTESGSC